MKLLIICTSIYALPPVGYSGLETLVFNLAQGLAAKGHTVSLVCPEGSKLSSSIEIIPTGVREEEEAVYVKYRSRIEDGNFDVILDSSWQRWASVSNLGRDPQIPIVNWHHTDPSVYATPIPVPHNLWVGLSQDHALRLARHFQMQVKWVHNGIDLDFYKANGRARGSRYLWLARYTPEKGPAEIISLAQKLRLGVDLYGDTEIIGEQSYMKECFKRADGFFAKASGGVPREQAVDLYTTHKGYLYWLNWEEPFGLSILEAMACECVPIVARRGAVPELIRDGVTGFIVDTLEQMEDLVKKNSIAEIDKEAMRDSVAENFSIQSFVNNWEKLLLTVAQGIRW